jgi:integral membrane protein
VSTQAAPSVAAIRRQLNIILPVAIIDGLLLIPLLIAAVTDAEDAVSILGPIHGVGFIILVGLTVQGVMKQMWGWWFPAVVIVTTGPPGSIVGDIVLRRQLPK